MHELQAGLFMCCMQTRQHIGGKILTSVKLAYKSQKTYAAPKSLCGLESPTLAKFCNLTNQGMVRTPNIAKVRVMLLGVSLFYQNIQYMCCLWKRSAHFREECQLFSNLFQKILFVVVSLLRLYRTHQSVRVSQLCLWD